MRCNLRKDVENWSFLRMWPFNRKKYHSRIRVCVDIFTDGGGDFESHQFVVEDTDDIELYEEAINTIHEIVKIYNANEKRKQDERDLEEYNRLKQKLNK